MFLLRRLFFPNHPVTLEWQMFHLLNRDRRQHGLKPLFMQEDLRKVARKHSKDMAKQDYFEHENLYGQTHADRYKEAQISDVHSGENLAKIAGYSYPAHRAEIGLMNSPGHRANILTKEFNCVGIGLHKSEDGIFYFTQNFAHRELLFERAPKKEVLMKQGLLLQFRPLGSARQGVYKIHEGLRVIQEKGFPIREKSNRLELRFPRAGIFLVQIYTGRLEERNLKLSNEFEVRVRKGWLW